MPERVLVVLFQRAWGPRSRSTSSNAHSVTILCSFAGISSTLSNIGARRVFREKARP